MKRLTKTILIAAAVVLLAFGAIFIYPRVSKKANDSELQERTGMLVDLNGDGKKEDVRLNTDESLGEGMNTTLEAYDEQGEVFASLPPEIPILEPMDNTFKTYQLDTNDTKEAFSFDFLFGPHQTERMFFELLKGKIIPICHEEEVTHPKDCLFYAANTDTGIEVGDLDGDGKAELVEIVDEYPADGQLSEEEETAIRQAFSKQGVNDSTEDAIRIAVREKGGRGNPVAWSIYSYNGFDFEEQTEEEYERYFSILKSGLPNLMRKSDLSKDSLEYNEFVKEFWN